MSTVTSGNIAVWLLAHGNLHLLSKKCLLVSWIGSSSPPGDLHHGHRLESAPRRMKKEAMRLGVDVPRVRLVV